MPHRPSQLQPVLTLAHSPDPDDVFMWWPITGKIRPDGSVIEPDADGLGTPVIETGRYRFRAVPADIEVLNRTAAASDRDALFDITAVSFRNYANIKSRYAITNSGSSFGDGFGPKVVVRPDRGLRSVDDLRSDGVRIAIPGRRTTAFLLLGLILGAKGQDGDGANQERFVELPFEQIIPAVARGEVDAGLVIHEGQVLFERAGLEMLVDTGAWWKQHRGLPTPLGANVIRRDLEARLGPGSVAEISGILRRSIEHALAHRAESVEYTMPFALANTAKSGAASGEPPTVDRVDRYIEMYVNRWTVDMGADGREAVTAILEEGHKSGLCPDPRPIDVF